MQICYLFQNSSTYNSVFNFDELRNNVDDLSQYVSREQRQPVQHSSENDGNHCGTDIFYLLKLLMKKAREIRNTTIIVNIFFK